VYFSTSPQKYIQIVFVGTAGGHHQGHLPQEEKRLGSPITEKNKLLAQLCSRD